jgi:hypothetical protein
VLAPSNAPELFRDLVVDLTQVRRYSASGELSGTQETPPVTTGTSGDFTVYYDRDLNKLEFEVTVVPTVTTPVTVTAAHFHVAPPGTPGPVVRTIDQEGVLPRVVTDTLTLSGVITDLSPVEIDQLLAGQFYINVHTPVHPAGEVRGQVELDPEANQPYIDEIDNEYHDGSQDPRPHAEDNLNSLPILYYAGPFNQQDGTVALANRDRPSLERPGTTYSGRSIYATFGLEGMSNSLNPSVGITPTTRTELLDLFFEWLWSEPGTAVISPTQVVTTSDLAIFSAGLTPAGAMPEKPLEGVRYRWDFGDGSTFVTSAGNQAGHTYLCGEDNTYTVRVEIMDQYGNTTIGSLLFDASAVCADSLQRKYFLPLIGRD